MIAVDTNILVYAHRRDSEFHSRAVNALRALVEGHRAWAVPWPCLHEFIAVTTHPRIFAPPSTLEQACHQVDVWLGSQGVVLLSEQTEYWGVLRGTIVPSHSVGPRVHDARVAALCAHHGVRVLWSADRDFSRYPSLSVVNPLKNE